VIPLLLALVACGPASDRDLYLEAMAAPAGQGRDTCLRILGAHLQGECLTHDAAALAVAGQVDVAFSLCQEIRDPVWQVECWFLCADEAELTGDRATHACRHTGRFRAHCLGHAIGREVKDVEARHGRVGQEVQLLQGIGSVVHRYKPGAPPDQRSVTEHTLAARIIAAREAEAPFDQARCGAAPPELCARAYPVSLDGTPREIDLEGQCDVERTPETVAASGARAWAEGSEDLAASVWASLCDDLESGRMSRDDLGQPGPPVPGRLPGE